MGENICKQSNWQGINLQNIQTADATQYQNKTTHYTSIRMPKTWHIDITKCWWGYWTEIVILCWLVIWNSAANLKDSLVISSKIKYTSNISRAISFFGIYQRTWKLMPMAGARGGARNSHRFSTALFIIAQTWKMPSSTEWIKKLWYSQTMEYYSLLKRNGL